MPREHSSYSAARLGDASPQQLRHYRTRNKGMQILLSNSQAGSGRTVKQEQEEISCNHGQAFIPGSVFSKQRSALSSPAHERRPGIIFQFIVIRQCVIEERERERGRRVVRSIAAAAKPIRRRTWFSHSAFHPSVPGCESAQSYVVLLRR